MLPPFKFFLADISLPPITLYVILPTVGQVIPISQYPNIPLPHYSTIPLFHYPNTPLTNKKAPQVSNSKDFA